MSIHLFDIQSIAERINQGALLLTPNQRLAKIITEAYHGYRISNPTTNSGSTNTWYTPKIYPIDSWLQKCWQCLLDLGITGTEKTLLDSNQDNSIWRQVIQSHTELNLINSQQTAGHAQQAYEHLLLWQLDPTDNNIREAFSWQENTKLFLQCLDGYQHICQAKKLIPLYATAGILRKELLKDPDILTSNQSLHPSLEIIITGFTNLAPLYKSILNSFNCSIYPHRININPKKISSFCLVDPDSEIRAAAQWAKKHLQHSSRETRPASIAVIIPDLAERRQQIEHIFYETLQADYMLPQHQRTLPPFNISAGQTLGDCPLIFSALCCLKLNFQHMEFKDLLYLLHSPFIFNWPQDQQLRCQIEMLIRNNGRQVLSGTRFRQLVKQSIDDFTTAQDNHPVITAEQDEPLADTMNMAETLQQFEIIHKQYKGQHPLSFFIQYFQQQLQLLNWPGTRPLDNIEYQQYQNWLENLQYLAQMDYLYDSLSLHEALELFHLHLSNQPFQPQTKPCQLHILGLLEGAGLQFDYCWISGLNDQVLPAIANPNPLLPLELQKNHLMPRASQRREYEFAKALLDIYQHSTTTEFAVSYSQFMDDQELRPSPFICNKDIFPDSKITTNQIHNPLTQQIADSSVMELIPCHNAPPLNRQEAIKGGSSILKDQAAAPLISFLVHRLNAKDLPQPYYGLSVLDRGNILHQCLAILWARLKNQQQLLSLNEQQCSDLINFAIEAALDHFTTHQQDLLKPRLRTLEIQRLHSLLTNYLELEKQRSPFKVVAREKSQLLELAGFSIQLRIDRIDQLNDSSILLIDYKSGLVNLKGWMDERLSEPQLPLYAFINTDRNINSENQQLTLIPADIHINPQVSGLCFVQINAEQCTFVGLAKNQIGPTGIKTLKQLPETQQTGSWEDLTNNWADQINQLAGEFSNGQITTAFYGTTSFFYDYLQVLIRPQDIMEIQERGTLDIKPSTNAHQLESGDKGSTGS